MKKIKMACFQTKGVGHVSFTPASCTSNKYDMMFSYTATANKSINQGLV